MSLVNHSINYVELPLKDADATKAFYAATFGWEFQDWGPDYLSFEGAEVAGGFSKAREATAAGTGPLIVLFANDLEATRNATSENGCQISLEIFEFPGGRRFHFIDPNGNEIAVWGDPSEVAPPE